MSHPGIDLLVATRRISTLPGGLARYQHHLVEELQARGTARIATCAAEGDALSSSVHDLNLPLPLVRESRRAWMSLGSRPLLHPLLEHWISTTYRPLVERLAGLHPRAVHFVGTGWDFFGFGMLSLARRCGARFTIWPAVHPGQWGDDRIDLRLYRAADTVFCQSQHEADHLVRLGLPTDRTVISGLPPMCLPDGDGPGFRYRHGLTDRLIVLYLGRREEEKGFDAVVRAWARVFRRHPEAILLLAGPGDSIQPADFLPAASYLDLEVPDEREKAAAYAACDIFCMPSRHESFGIVFAEAWSYNKPVVCGEAPAPREWIADGTTGLWSDGQPRDVEAKLLRLLDDSALRREMGRAGGAFQRKSLTWDVIAPAHLQAFGLSPAAHE